jgi:hypothetical protein
MTAYTYHKKFTDSEIKAIVSALKMLPAPPQAPAGPVASNSALKVLECVLSLNRKYEEFVAPKLDDFKKRNPAVTSLSALDSLRKLRGGADSFFSTDLKYHDKKRAQVFELGLTYLTQVAPRFPGRNESERLYNWATSVKPTDYQHMFCVQGHGHCHPKGFAIAGWQYLRMLFGADTCKPDRHILNFLKYTIGRNVNPVNAVELMEIAAPLAGLTVRDADLRVWAKYSQRSKAAKSRTCRRPGSTSC